MKKLFTGQEQDSVQGIYRLGNHFVNWFIIDTTDGITVIDAGFPGHWQQFVKSINVIGCQLTDVKAILLTHAHADHVGFAERARQETVAEIWIHKADAGAACNGLNDPPPPAIMRNLWRPKICLRMITALLFEGILEDNAIQKVHTFRDGDELPVPGKPRVIYVPGHTIGSSVFYLPETAVLFTGDAICTEDPMTAKRTPPSIIKSPLSDDSALAKQSLNKLKDLGQALLLPGHGKPWQGDIKQAVNSAQNT